jgi:DNA-binding response OmpR family regulator
MAKRILIVDDEPGVCAYLGEFLEGVGYQVFTALTGTEGIQLLKEERPHVVLLDIRMPEPDGLAVLGQMKEIDPRAMVIMVTALEDRQTALRALELGADGYIHKPVDLAYLRDLIKAKIAMMTA